MKIRGGFAHIAWGLFTWAMLLALSIIAVLELVSFAYKAYSRHPRPPVDGELAQIHIMPGSTRIVDDEDDLHFAYVSREFVVSGSGYDIASYYRDELTSRGWRFSTTSANGIWVTDYFCKSGLSARVNVDFKPEFDGAKTAYEIEIWRENVLFPNPKTDCILFDGSFYVPTGSVE